MESKGKEHGKRPCYHQIAEEAESVKLETSRWQEVARNEDNNEETNSTAVLTGLAKTLTRQGRVPPWGG